MDMTKKAPHLPNKTCRVDTYYRLQSIRWILLFALLSFVAGGSAATIVVSWVLPTYSQVQIIQTTFDNRTSLDSLPDTLLKKQTDQRMLSVYDKRLRVMDNVYPDDSLVSKAVVLSSDGWIVLPVNNYSYKKEINWEVVDEKNIVYPIEETVFDGSNNLLYIKIEAGSLRVLSFFDWKKMEVGYNLWSVEKDIWKKKIVNKILASNDESLDLLKSLPGLEFGEPLIGGSFLLNSQGELVGVVVGDGRIVPSWLLEYQVDSLLGTGELNNVSNSWQGYFVKVFNERDISETAFYIETAPALANTSTLILGDLILKINDEIVDKASLTSQIWLSSSDINFSILRGGVEHSIVMPKRLFLP